MFKFCLFSLSLAIESSVEKMKCELLELKDEKQQIENHLQVYYNTQTGKEPCKVKSPVYKFKNMF